MGYPRVIFVVPIVMGYPQKPWFLLSWPRFWGYPWSPCWLWTSSNCGAGVNSHSAVNINSNQFPQIIVVPIIDIYILDNYVPNAWRILALLNGHPKKKHNIPARHRERLSNPGVSVSTTNCVWNMSCWIKGDKVCWGSMLDFGSVEVYHPVN